MSWALQRFDLLIEEEGSLVVKPVILSGKEGLSAFVKRCGLNLSGFRARGGAELTRFPALNLKVTARFFGHLSRLLEGEQDLVKAMEELGKLSSKSVEAALAQSLLFQLKAGFRLSESFQIYERCFPAPWMLWVDLDQARLTFLFRELEALALRASALLRKSFTLLIPWAQAVGFTCLGAKLIAYAVGNFDQLFPGKSHSYPVWTVAYLKLDALLRFASCYFFYGLAGVVMGWVFMRKLFKPHQRCMRLASRMPGLRKLSSDYDNYLIFKTLALSLPHALKVSPLLDLNAFLIQNSSRRRCALFALLITEGWSLQRALVSSELCPSVEEVKALQLAEQTSRLSEVCDQLSSRYREQLFDRIARLLNLLERIGVGWNMMNVASLSFTLYSVLFQSGFEETLGGH